MTDLGTATMVALLSLTAVLLVLLLVAAVMTLLVRLPAGKDEESSKIRLPDTNLEQRRAQAAAVAVSVALAQRSMSPAPVAMSPWLLALRTAQLTRWRPRR